MYPFTVPFASCLLFAALASAAGSGGVNAPEHSGKPYVILISIDGLGRIARERAATPALDRLAAEGVAARSMRPVWPTLTFPNHYAIATGLYPHAHGIVGNTYPDGKRRAWYSLQNRQAVQDPGWYAGEPVWVSAEKAGMVSAAYFFVGSEAPIQGIRPTYSYLFDSGVPAATRVEQVLTWLDMPAAKRPHLIALYFEHVDSASHRHGPGAAETAAAVTGIDSHIQTLLDGIDALPFADAIYVIVVSDHGQSAYVAADEPYVLDEHVAIGEATVVQGGNYVKLYYEAADAAAIAAMTATINRTWCCGKAYARRDAPAHWRVADDDRYPDVIIQADSGHAVITDDSHRQRLAGGAHGWPPVAEAMGATFIARGPRLPRATRIGEIHVTDVYPMMLELLGLPLPAGHVVESRVLLDVLTPAH